MDVPRMHDEEVAVDDALVRRLLTEQLPRLAARRLTRVTAWGTDHVIYRLGDDLSVRLPKIGWAAAQGEKERRWLPVIAPHVPVDVPVVVAVGHPAEGYPYPWYVAPWLEGDNPTLDGTVELPRLAADLAAFVRALQRVDPAGAPRPSGSHRAGPAAGADEVTRRRAEQLRRVASDGEDDDVDALLAVWEEGMRAPAWGRPPVWVHADLSDGNILVRGGRLTGVIDWGAMVAGDPAVELMIAWQFFDAESRVVYRDALGFVDDATWLRGRAWAAGAALQSLPYYRDTNQDIVARSRRAARAVIADAAGR